MPLTAVHEITFRLGRLIVATSMMLILTRGKLLSDWSDIFLPVIHLLRSVQWTLW